MIEGRQEVFKLTRSFVFRRSEELAAMIGLVIYTIDEVPISKPIFWSH